MTCLVYACTVAYIGQITFYKVPEQHGQVYLVGLKISYFEEFLLIELNYVDLELKNFIFTWSRFDWLVLRLSNSSIYHTLNSNDFNSLTLQGWVFEKSKFKIKLGKKFDNLFLFFSKTLFFCLYFPKNGPYLSIFQKKTPKIDPLYPVYCQFLYLDF